MNKGMDKHKSRVWDIYRKCYLDKFLISEEGEIVSLLCGIFGHKDKPSDYIIEQCAGLKDHNDELIYEGDIIQYEWQTQALAPHVWKTSTKVLLDIRRDFVWLDNILKGDRNVTVIGNIHTNPELLEEGQ